MSKILFVVEGESRELDIFNNIKSVFFSANTELVTIFAPAGMNIYMLFCKLKEDNFETDPIEIIKENSEEAHNILKDYSRDDFAEIYYFFDFDEHGNNVPLKYKTDNIGILKQMLSIFDNETELGKLYISYPMVEALRDFKSGRCGVASGDCFRSRADFGTYKHDSASSSQNNNFNSYDFVKWMSVAYNYIHRICCLFNIKTLDRNKYISSIKPIDIFDKEICLYNNNEKIFILSALPEFIIDYSEKWWNSAVGKMTRFNLDDNCRFK